MKVNSRKLQRYQFVVRHFVVHRCASFFNGSRQLHVALDEFLERLVHEASANLSLALSVDAKLG
jgi:hypothetical protein